jgi:phosphoribosyl 1,2-cyclic phosphate phosphodiesterase
MDDLRPLTVAERLPVYGNEPTIAEVRERFAYAFRESQLGGGKPRFDLRVIGEEGTVEAGGLVAAPLPVKHGRLDILGWLFTEGSIRAAYLTDVSRIEPSVLARLGDLDLLVVGALRERKHETHYSFAEALDLVRGLAPRRALLTHLCHEHAHREIAVYCTDRSAPVAPAYDGLSVVLAQKETT